MSFDVNTNIPSTQLFSGKLMYISLCVLPTITLIHQRIDLASREPSSSSIPATVCLGYPRVRHTSPLDFLLFFSEKPKKGLWSSPEFIRQLMFHDSGGCHALPTRQQTQLAASWLLHLGQLPHETQGIPSPDGGEREVINEDLSS